MQKTRYFRTVMAIAVALALAPVAVNAARKKVSVPARAAAIKPDGSTAVVSFIRRAAFMGDAWDYDIWDGNEYVGSLGAGNLLQHRAKPGEHVYLMMARGVHIWAYMKADVLPGKEYFARAFRAPFSLEPVDSNSDERVETWASMRIDDVTEYGRKKAVKKFGAELQLALAAFGNGERSPDCGVWLPPDKKGEKAKQPGADSGCRPVGVMKPEMGR
jgi:hypothetical protein